MEKPNSDRVFRDKTEIYENVTWEGTFERYEQGMHKSKAKNRELTGLPSLMQYQTVYTCSISFIYATARLMGPTKSIETFAPVLGVQA